MNFFISATCLMMNHVLCSLLLEKSCLCLLEINNSLFTMVKTYWLYFLQRHKIPPKLHLMVRLQFWSFGECRVPLHCHYFNGRSLCGIEANMLNWAIVVCKFKLQSCYNIHFWTDTLGKGMNLLIPQAMH